MDDRPRRHGRRRFGARSAVRNLRGRPDGLLFAATYPERTSRSILYGALPVSPRRRTIPGVAHPEEQRALPGGHRASAGASPAIVGTVAPSLADDEHLAAMVGQLRCGSGASPGRRSLWRGCSSRSTCGTSCRPSGSPRSCCTGRDNAAGRRQSRYLAEHIPGAKYVELDGDDHFPWVGDTDDMLDEIEEFLTGARPAASRTGSWPRSCSPTSSARPSARRRSAIAAGGAARAHHDGRAARARPLPWP